MYIRLYIYTYLYTYIYSYIYVCVYICIYMYIYIYMHKYVFYICMYTYIYIYTHLHVYMCPYMQINESRRSSASLQCYCSWKILIWNVALPWPPVALPYPPSRYGIICVLIHTRHESFRIHLCDTTRIYIYIYIYEYIHISHGHHWHCPCRVCIQVWIHMCELTHLNESWVMSLEWMCQGTLVHASCRACQSVMSHVWMHRLPHMSASTHCNTLQHTATHCDTLWHTSNTLQHIATHCNTVLVRACPTPAAALESWHTYNK